MICIAAATKLGKFLIAAGVLLLGGSSVAIGCNPALATVCQRFERAEAVFVGTLIKAEKRREGNLIPLYATFKVHEVYKGKPGPEETIKFGTGDCDPVIDSVGATYFVYKEPYSRIPSVANYTHVFGPSDPDLAYAKHISGKKPVFSIGGRIWGLSSTDLAKVRIIVIRNGRKKIIKPDSKGMYDYTTARSGVYKVRVQLPSAVRFWVEQLNGMFPSVEGKTFTYETAFRPNGCDFLEFNVSPIETS